MGTTGGASDGGVVSSPGGMVEGTYTDEDVTKTYLVVASFDATTLSANIAAQAINARRKVNTYLGRTTNFTTTQLADEAYAGIVDGASQLTACLVQSNPQAHAMNLTEDTKVDCSEAYKTLKNWALKNGVTPASMMKVPTSQKSELVFIYPAKENVI
jgi:hypothetical protein